MSSIGKLYYTTTSCGAASYIAATHAGLKFESEQVNIQTHKTDSGADYYGINPKGNVPTLVLPGGVTLNEGAAVLQYIADQNPKSELAPANGTVDRYVLINTLNYVATEVHKAYGPLFNPTNTAEQKAYYLSNLEKKFDYLEKHELNGDKKFLLFNHLTIADIYLYIVLSWSPYVGAKLESRSILKKYFDGIASHPSVVNAHAEMNAAKKA